MNLPNESLIQGNVPLCRYSTFQIGGLAQFFSQPTQREQLVDLFEFQKKSGVPYVVMGRGSNVLFSDDGFPGLVISLQKFEADKINFSPEGLVKVSAGFNLYRLSRLCQLQGVSGLEFVCHIPGTVGGAVWMNAGFGRPDKPYTEIKDVLESVTVLGKDGKIRILNRSDINFTYRESNLHGYMILDATFRVKKSTTEKVLADVQANFTYRNAVQDLRYPSAGSVFKNPNKKSKFSSGQLIDKVGLKGYRIGGAMISEKHGNFIVNVGQAKARDVLALIELVQNRVKEFFDVELEPEVKIIVPNAEFKSIEVGALV